MEKLALGDRVGYIGGQGMDTLAGELEDIREESIPKMPEILLRLDNGTNSIKGKLVHPLTLTGNGPIVDEGLKSLSIFTLKHHLQLLPTCVVVNSLIRIDFEDFQVIGRPGVEDFPVL